jgi:hypothetical protein
LVRAAKKQEEEAAAFMRTYYTAEVDLIETPQAEFQPERQPKTSDAAKKGKSLAKTGVQNLQQLWGATTEEEVRAAIGHFEGLTQGLRLNIDKDENGVRTLYITTPDGTTTENVIGSDFKQFTEQVASRLMDVTYYDEAMELNPLDTTKYPSVGSALGRIETMRMLDPDNIRAETVDMFGVQETVGNILSPETLPSIPVGMLGLGAAYGINRPESDAQAQRDSATINRMLEDLGVNDKISVVVKSTDETDSDFPSIVVNKEGQVREFSMKEGLYEGIGEHILSLISDVAVRAPAPSATQTNKVNYAGK